MDIIEQRILFKQSAKNGRILTRVITMDSHPGKIELILTISTESGHEIQRFAGIYTKRRLKRYLKRVFGCPRTMGSIWEWRKFIIDNADIVFSLLPLKEIKNRTVIQ